MKLKLYPQAVWYNSKRQLLFVRLLLTAIGCEKCQDMFCTQRKHTALHKIIELKIVTVYKLLFNRVVHCACTLSIGKQQLSTSNCKMKVTVESWLRERERDSICTYFYLCLWFIRVEFNWIFYQYLFRINWAFEEKIEYLFVLCVFTTCAVPPLSLPPTKTLPNAILSFAATFDIYDTLTSSHSKLYFETIWFCFLRRIDTRLGV